MSNEPSITMEFSPSLTNIIPAFIAAKKEMGPLVKGANNPFFKSKYADLGSVIDVSEAALLEQGIATLQGVGGDGAHVSVTTLLAHTSGEWIKSTVVFGVTIQEVTIRDDDEGKITKTVKHDPQAAGSVVSYLRRYSLQAMCNLAAEDDDGQQAARPTPAAPKTNVHAARRAQNQPAVPGIDPNALLLKAVEVGVIPSADRLMFKAWAREKVAGCAGLLDNAPLTPLHFAAIEKALAEAKPPLRALPDTLPTDEQALKRQRRTLRANIIALCRGLNLSDDDRHEAEKKHRVLGMRDEVIDQVPIALLEALQRDLAGRKEDAPLDPDDGLEQYAQDRLV